MVSRLPSTILRSLFSVKQNERKRHQVLRILSYQFEIFLAVGDYTRIIPPVTVNDNEVPPLSMNLRSATYYTAQEVENGVVQEGQEDEGDVTTDSGDDTEARFDSDNESEFNPDFDEEDV